MLQRITVHNLALIRDLEIEFSSELNVLSGETGAGKSIIVDSLMLLIGARYDKTMLKYGEDKGFVEGVFTCSDTSPLADMGIDDEDGLLIVTRKFYRDGKNEIRVNGKQMTTAMLRELMANYVDIYGQNEYQSLLKVSEQKKMFDSFVFRQDGDALKKQRELYDEYKSIVAELAKLGDDRERAQRIDILKYQIDEIEKAKIEKDEEDRLVERRHVLMSSERIKSSLADCYDKLDGDDGVSSLLSEAIRAVSAFTQFGEKYETFVSRLKSSAIEIDDIAECIKDELDGMDMSERELDEVIDRLDKIRALKSKYGPYDSMMKFLADAKTELDRAENGADLYEKLQAKERKLRSELYENCERLSELRRGGAALLQKRVLAELDDLGMANSRFEVTFKQQPDTDSFVKTVTPVGFDEFEFYFAPNAGQPLLPLAKIISGGEMSRFILAVKLVTGDTDSLDTMIFDEIDTGISGAIGLAVAKKLCELSRGRQVLCVTHLAQIAAMADSHFYIDKYDDDKGTVTRVTVLDRSGQVGEISRLSGTQGVSDTSQKSADELKSWCDQYKNKIASR